jgi:chromate transport protein ChrA
MQRLFSFVFAISPSLERVSGSTSHILLILTRSRLRCLYLGYGGGVSSIGERAVEVVGRSGSWIGEVVCYGVVVALSKEAFLEAMVYCHVVCMFV